MTKATKNASSKLRAALEAAECTEEAAPHSKVWFTDNIQDGPLVGDTATQLNQIFPDRVLAVNKKLPAKVASGAREVDIIMDQFIVQVKRGKGKGLVGQVIDTMETLIDNDKRVIGYAPDRFAMHSWMAAVEAGVPVARSLGELVDIIKEFTK